MNQSCLKEKSRINRKKRIRKKISGTMERPRLTVFKSAKHIYAQIIDDISGQTQVAASTMEKSFSNSVKTKDNQFPKQTDAEIIGKTVAERAIEKGIKKIVFDRNGYIYHGRIKAVSDGARKAGLEF